MSAYIVFTRVRTRNPAQLDLYAKQAPTFLAAHAIKWLAHFGPCEVVEGRALSRSRSSNSPRLPRRRPGMQAPPIKRRASIGFGAATTAPSFWRVRC
jgi:hypothetical protein